MTSREKIIATARDYAKQGRYDLAIGEYQRLVAAFPEDLRSRIKLGFLHARNGDDQTAVDLWLEVAHGFEHKGASADAATVLQQVLRLDPDHVDTHLWLAELYSGLGQPAESRHELEVAHTLLEQRDRVFDALRVLEDMVALDSGNVALCIRLGEAYAANDRKEEAVEILTRAADVLRQAEWVDDFIRVAERLVWLEPENIELNKELASYYLHKRDPQAALQRLKRCYEADQTDVGTLKLLADTFIDLREPEKAATILRVLAGVFEQRQERSHAEAVLDHAYRLDPESRSEEAPAAVPLSENEGGELLAEPGDAVSDPSLLELEEGDWVWQPPAAADARDLSPLEMSLQPEGAEEDAPRRFLPAVTADGRHGRLATSPRHRMVTTQEIDFSDIVFLENHRSASTQVTSPDLHGRVRPARVVATTELDLADLEELDPDSMDGDSATEKHDAAFGDFHEVTEEITAVTAPPDLSTHEVALNELEDLAGELSDRYLGPRSQGAGGSKEIETVKYRHNPPHLRTDPGGQPDEKVGDTRRSQRPGDPSSTSPDPRGSGGRRSGR